MLKRIIAASLLGISAISMTVSLAATRDDPFLWLEEVEGEKALDWVRSENAKSLGELEADPHYARYLADAAQILKAEDRIPYPAMVDAKNGYVYNFWQDAIHVQGLWRRTSLDGYRSAEPQWETVLDLDALSKAENETWVFKGADCLGPDNRFCLVTLSRGGSDASEQREFDTERKEFVPDGFFLKEAKSGTSWVDADTILVGTDFGEGALTTSGYPRITKLWRRGTPLDQAPVLLEGKTTDTGVWPSTFEDATGQISIINRAVTFFDSEYYLVDGENPARQIPLPLSAELLGYHKGKLIVRLRADWTVALTSGEKETTYAQGALIAFGLQDWAKSGTVAADLLIAPGPREAVEDVAITRDAVIVTMLDNVRGRVRALTYDAGAKSWTPQDIAVPDNGSASVLGTSPEASFFMINFESFLVPGQLSFAPGLDTAPSVIKSLPARFNADGYVTEQFEAVSTDGTKIPYFVVRHGDKSGPMPMLLYGYGGFQVSMNPWYWSTAGKLWLEEGGAYAVANIRGGGEFGPAWHEAARGVNRQRAYDDFTAVAQDLIARGLSSPQKLGISGGSNGGLLVGVAFTQRPELYHAVICAVPLLDMLRYTKLPPGASWIAEYGDPEDPAMRAAIEKYSPYQNLSGDKSYPRVLFLTSTKDDRVNPAHARKMAALMESLGKPMLYYENIEGGHSAAANLDQRAKQLALQYVYLRRQLMGAGG